MGFLNAGFCKLVVPKNIITGKCNTIDWESPLEIPSPDVQSASNIGVAVLCSGTNISVYITQWASCGVL